MKFLPLAAILASFSAVSHGQEWSVSSASEGENVVLSNGVFHELFITGKSPELAGRRFGPVSVWIPRGQNTPVMISQSLSSVDEALREDYKRNPQRALGKLPIYIGYYKGKEAASLVSGPDQPKFLEKLRPRVSPERFREIDSVLSEHKPSAQENVWEFGMTIVTWRGAIERHTYSGTREPLALKKEIVEILAPAGTVPNFEF